MNDTLRHLGQTVSYVPSDNTQFSQILDRVPRNGRSVSGYGDDFWICYELSWLDFYKIPNFKIGVLRIPSDSQFIVESKSLKLYFHQFNNHIFNDESEFIRQVCSDLKRILNSDVTLTLLDPLNIAPALLEGVCLETVYRNPGGLDATQSTLSVSHMNTVYTHAFRSNCPVTNQPDWATIVIKFSGNSVNLGQLFESLLAYRNENAFHEDCMTSIFSALQTAYSFSKLSIYGAFSRRGGIAIHPFRSNYCDDPHPLFLVKS